MLDILVIEDDPAVGDMVCLALESEDYTASWAASGKDGVAQARAKHPRLILLDFLLPDIEGEEVTRRLRSHAETRDIPIVLMTAVDHPFARGAALDIQAVVEKPFDFLVLLGTIARYIRHQPSSTHAYQGVTGRLPRGDG